MQLDGQEEWGRDALQPANMLYVYRPGGKREETYLKTVAGASNEGRLFLHDLCTGQRRTYAIEHVNTLLNAKENIDGIKERIVALLPRLSTQQKKWVAEGISDDALAAVKTIDYGVGEQVEAWRHGSALDRVPEHSPSLVQGL